MSFAGTSIQANLLEIRLNYASGDCVKSQVNTRVESLKVFGQELWQIIVNLGESFKGLIGATLRIPVGIVRWIAPGSVNVNRFYDWLPSCQHMLSSVVKTAQATLGAISSLTLGVIVNPNWNFTVQQKLGIVNAPTIN
jgi:hypothetical protein